MLRVRTPALSGSRVLRACAALAITAIAAVSFASAAFAQTPSPVYRFYNLQRGSHFYTISASERD
jgi:hypothetical protein